MLLVAWFSISLLFSEQANARQSDCLAPAKDAGERLWAIGARLASERARQHGDPPFDVRTLRVVHTGAECLAAARAYDWNRRRRAHGMTTGMTTRPGSAGPVPAYRVIVLRLGTRGYLIQAPADTARIAGYRCNLAQTDSAFMPQAGLCEP